MQFSARVAERMVIQNIFRNVSVS